MPTYALAGSQSCPNCGLDCSKCDAFIATRNNDFDRKSQIAKRWSETLNVKFNPEDINCIGCMSNQISGWCTKICKIRPCAVGRKLETCAHCAEYLCGQLKEFLSDEPVAAETLGEIRRTLTPQPD